jgi:tricorn protease
VRPERTDTNAWNPRQYLHVPVKKGDIRNLKRSSGAHERSPAWSPDGKQLAWSSDASGEYKLILEDQKGFEKPRTIQLPSTGFFSDPVIIKKWLTNYPF